MAVVPSNESVDSEHGTLTASTVKTVSLTKGNANAVVVHMVSGTGPIYYTLNGDSPTVGGAETLVVHANLPVRSHQITTGSTQTVKLISATADGYSVEAV